MVILCISLKDGNEDDTVAEWRKELEEKCHGVPVVIVGKITKEVVVVVLYFTYYTYRRL